MCGSNWSPFVCECLLTKTLATALKKRHSKTADDTKYTGSVLARAHDQGLVIVEGGGEIDSIQAWVAKRRQPLRKSPEPEVESRPASSGLSSVGTMADEMDMTGV